MLKNRLVAEVSLMSFTILGVLILACYIYYHTEIMQFVVLYTWVRNALMRVQWLSTYILPRVYDNIAWHY